MTSISIGRNMKWCTFQRKNKRKRWEPVAILYRLIGPSAQREIIRPRQGGRRFYQNFRNQGMILVKLKFLSLKDYEKINKDFESDDICEYGLSLTDKNKTRLRFPAVITELPLSILTPVTKVLSKKKFWITLQVAGSVTTRENKR